MFEEADQAVDHSVCTGDDTDKSCPDIQVETKVHLSGGESLAMRSSPGKATAWAEGKSILEDRTFHGWGRLAPEIQGMNCKQLPNDSLYSAILAHSSLHPWITDEISRQMTLNFSSGAGLHSANPLHKATDNNADIDKVRDRIQDVTVRLSPTLSPQCWIASDVSTSMQKRELRNLRIQATNPHSELTIEGLIRALPCATLILDADSTQVTSSSLLVSASDPVWKPPPPTVVQNVVLICDASNQTPKCSATRDVRAERSCSFVALEDDGSIEYIISQYYLPGSRLGVARWTAAPEDPDIPCRLLLERGGVARTRREDEVTDDEADQTGGWIPEETALHTVMDIPAAARELSKVLDYLDETREEKQGEWELGKDELNGILTLTLK